MRRMHLFTFIVCTLHFRSQVVVLLRLKRSNASGFCSMVALSHSPTRGCTLTAFMVCR